MDIQKSKETQISSEEQSDQRRTLSIRRNVIPLPVAGICLSSYCNALPQIDPYFVAPDVALTPFKKPPRVDVTAEAVAQILRQYEDYQIDLLKTGQRVLRWGRVPVIGRLVRQSAHRKLLDVLDKIVVLPSARTSMQDHIDEVFGVHEALLFVAFSELQTRGRHIPVLPYVLMAGPGRTFATAGKVGVRRLGNLQQQLLERFNVSVVPALLLILPDQEFFKAFRASGDEDVAIEISRDLVDQMGVTGVIKFLMAPRGLILRSQVRGRGARGGGARWCDGFTNGARLDFHLGDYLRYQADFVHLLAVYLSGGSNFARELVAETTRDTVILVGGPVSLTARGAEVSTAPALLKYLPVDPDDMRCGMLGVVSTETQARLLGYSDSLYIKIRRDMLQPRLFSVVKVTVNEAIEAYCSYLREIQEDGVYREICGS